MFAVEILQYRSVSVLVYHWKWFR